MESGEITNNSLYPELMHCCLLALLLTKQVTFLLNLIPTKNFSATWPQRSLMSPNSICLKQTFWAYSQYQNLRDSALFLCHSVFLCALGGLAFLNRILYILSLINPLLGTVTICGFQVLSEIPVLCPVSHLSQELIIWSFLVIDFGIYFEKSKT